MSDSAFNLQGLVEGTVIQACSNSGKYKSQISSKSVWPPILCISSLAIWIILDRFARHTRDCRYHCDPVTEARCVRTPFARQGQLESGWASRLRTNALRSDAGWSVDNLFLWREKHRTDAVMICLMVFMSCYDDGRTRTSGVAGRDNWKGRNKRYS